MSPTTASRASRAAAGGAFELRAFLKLLHYDAMPRIRDDRLPRRLDLFGAVSRDG